MTGSDISGVVYLKVPDLEGHEQEEQKTYISGRQAGYINFLTSKRGPPALPGWQ